MILTCSECATRYVVKPASIPAGGRTVRCAKCGHTWHQDPTEDVSALETVDIPAFAEDEPRLRPMSSESNLPATREPPLLSPRSLKWTFFGLLLLIVITALLVYREPFSRMLPGLGAVYGALGLYGSEGVALSNVRVSPIPGRKTQYLVEGELINNSDKPRVTPKMYVSQRDKDKNILETQPIDRESAMLQPGKGSSFRFKITDKAGTTAFLTIDLGSARK
ncbi:MAG: zinc-ribbon domain-containing protein [Alphaproteobacteria bacterium]|nr:zinc-ribbon domain-containing protein [Alphaproteobacteria bacterium]